MVVVDFGFERDLSVRLHLAHVGQGVNFDVLELDFAAALNVVVFWKGTEFGRAFGLFLDKA